MKARPICRSRESSRAAAIASERRARWPAGVPPFSPAVSRWWPVRRRPRPAVRHQGRLLALRREGETLRGGLLAGALFLSTDGFSLALKEGAADVSWLNQDDGSRLITVSPQAATSLRLDVVLRETAPPHTLYLLDDRGAIQRKVETEQGTAALELEGEGPFMLATLPAGFNPGDWTVPRLEVPHMD